MKLVKYVRPYPYNYSCLTLNKEYEAVFHPNADVYTIINDNGLKCNYPSSAFDDVTDLDNQISALEDLLKKKITERNATKKKNPFWNYFNSQRGSDRITYALESINFEIGPHASNGMGLYFKADSPDSCGIVLDKDYDWSIELMPNGYTLLTCKERVALDT